MLHIYFVRTLLLLLSVPFHVMNVRCVDLMLLGACGWEGVVSEKKAVHNYIFHPS